MFSDTLALNLDLAIKDDLFQIPGGSIKNFQISIYDFGFDAEVDFWISADVSEDKLFSKFTQLDSIQVRLSIRGVYNLPAPAPEPLVVGGQATWKSVREVAFEEVREKPVLFRHYTIRFQDTARVLWHQHYPTALYESVKLADVINAQLVKGISLRMDWDVLEKEQSLICLSQGAFPNDASFYDFLIWYTASQKGVFLYDSQEQSYKLADSKNTQGLEVSFLPHEIEDVRVHLPETIRHSVRILNADADKPRSEDIDQKQSVSGTRRDVLLRTAIIADVDGRKQLEGRKLNTREHEIELVLAQFPAKTLRTGTSVHFDKDTWSKKTFPYAKRYRVCRIQVNGHARTQEPDHELDTDFAAYDLEMTARLESKNNPHTDLPSFTPPRYPIYVEGVIISAIGEDTDKTYQLFSDEKTSQDFYTVRVPLWNKEIRVMFAPDFTSGHLYFPAYRNTRVLLALYFDHARIERFLNWGDDVRLPMETQGDQILMGKSGESRIAIQHVYRDAKPSFMIDRACGIDTEFIQLKEGSLILETKDDESKKDRKETYNVTPRVAEARFKIASENQAAAAKLQADFQKTQSEVTGDLTQSVTEVRGRLDAMDAEMTAKVNEIQSRIETVMQQLSEKVSGLQGRAGSVKGELKEKVLL